MRRGLQAVNRAQQHVVPDPYHPVGTSKSDAPLGPCKLATLQGGPTARLRRHVSAASFSASGTLASKPHYLTPSCPQLLRVCGAPRTPGTMLRAPCTQVASLAAPRSGLDPEQQPSGQQVTFHCEATMQGTMQHAGQHAGTKQPLRPLLIPCLHIEWCSCAL